MKMRFLIALPLFAALFHINIKAQEAGDGLPPSNRTISAGIVNGKATNLVKPAYPDAARAVKASGAVNVQVTIDEEGNVIEAAAISGHPLLRSAAVAAAKKSTFSPTFLSGNAVKVTGVIVYNFVPGNTSNFRTEKQMFVPLGLPLILTAFKLTDPDDESRKLFRELSNTVPEELPEAKASMIQLSRTRSRTERDQLVDELIGTFIGDMTGTDQWLAELGKAWGEAVFSTLAISKTDSKSNRRVFTQHIASINELLENPPADISPEFIGKVKEISAFGDESYTQTDEFMTDFLRGSMSFIDTLIKS